MKARDQAGKAFGAVNGDVGDGPQPLHELRGALLPALLVPPEKLGLHIDVRQLLVQDPGAVHALRDMEDGVFRDDQE